MAFTFEVAFRHSGYRISIPSHVCRSGREPSRSDSEVRDSFVFFQGQHLVPADDERPFFSQLPNELRAPRGFSKIASLYIYISIYLFIYLFGVLDRYVRTCSPY